MLPTKTFRRFFHAFALVLGLQLALAETPPLKVGDTFPDLTKFAIEGRLPECLKGKVVVVDFWASWCGPCKQSFPFLETVYHRYRDRGLIICAVNVDESRAAMEEFLKEHPVSFNVVRDEKKRLVAAVNIPSMPTSFILAPDGKVHSIHHGFGRQEARKEYIKEVEELLQARSTRVP